MCLWGVVTGLRLSPNRTPVYFELAVSALYRAARVAKNDSPCRALSSCTPCTPLQSPDLWHRSREPLPPAQALYLCLSNAQLYIILCWWPTVVLTLVTSKAVAETRMLSPLFDGVLHSIVPMSSIRTWQCQVHTSYLSILVHHCIIYTCKSTPKSA